MSNNYNLSLFWKRFSEKIPSHFIFTQMHINNTARLFKAFENYSDIDIIIFTSFGQTCVILIWFIVSKSLDEISLDALFVNVTMLTVEMQIIR